MTPIEVAAGQVGYQEGAGNDNKYGAALGLNHEPWCALFVTWCYQQAGHQLPSMQPGMPTGYAAVAYGIGWAKANGLWRPSWEAQPNDAICYGWDGPNSSWARMHTGLIVTAGARGTTGSTIEGNRGDRVGRHTFTVGADDVLGTIALSKLLPSTPAKPAAVTKPPQPQPRPPAHPANTGPEDGMRFMFEYGNGGIYLVTGPVVTHLKTKAEVTEQNGQHVPVYDLPDRTKKALADKAV